jgi:WD40 repeat protein
MHKNPSTCLAYDETGRLYSGGYDGRVIAFEDDSRSVRWSVRHEGLVNAVCVGPTIVASGGADRVVRLWNRETGGEVGQPIGPRTDDINLIFLSSDESKVILAGDEGRLSCYETAERTLLWERYCAPPDRYGESIEAAAVAGDFSRAGERVYFAADNSGRYIMCLEDGTLLRADRLEFGEEAGSSDVECATADETRQQFIVGMADGSVVGVSLDCERKPWRLKIHHSAVKAITLRGSLMICGSYDNRIFSVDLESGQVESSTYLAGQGRYGWSRDMVSHPNTEGIFACTSLGQAPQIWNSKGLVPEVEEAPPTRGINAVCCLRSRIIAGCDSGELWLAGQLRPTLLCNLDSMVLGLTHQGKGFVLGAATHDGAFSLVEAGTGQVLRRSERMGDPAVCCETSPDGRIVAVGHYSGMVRLLDSHDLTSKAEFECSDTVKALSFISNERLAAGIANGNLELWDLEGPSQLAIRGGLFLTNDVSYSANSNFLYTVGRDCLLRRWTDELELSAVWSKHARSIKVVAVSPDGGWVCTSGYDAAICFQHVDGTTTEFQGHDWPGVPALEWLDSDYVVSGGWDGTIRTWSPVHGEVGCTNLPVGE